MTHFLLTFSCLLFSSIALARETQVIELGREIRWPRVSDRVWVKNPKILKIRAEGSFILVKGLKNGSTDLIFGSRSKQIFVWDAQRVQAYSVLQNLTRKIPGLRVGPTEEGPELQGELYRLEDFLKVRQALLDTPAWFFSLRMNPRLRSQLEDKIRASYRSSHLPLPALVGDQSWEIRWNHASSLEKPSQELAATWGLRWRKDSSSLALEPTVRVEVAIMEVRRQVLLQYGLEWPSVFQAQLVPQAGLRLSELAWKAHALESKGLGRVLARPNLICRSGQEAEFMAGGEFPIKLVRSRSQEVIWKKYGILLKVKPQADLSGRLRLHLETEISNLDFSSAVEGIPGVLVNKVSSHFDLARSQTIALSGLVKSETGKQIEGVPGLLKVPLLGALFGSQEWREQKTELVILVRPHVLEAQP